MALCPPIETLRYLGIRPEEGTGFEELERHIEQCASCQIVLERLAREPAAEPVLPNTELQADSLPTIPGFEIEAEIGRGGMGVVYRAWQPRLMRRVALKIVPSGPVTEAHKRWLNEARAVSCIRDPRVVQLHDVGEAGGWLYLTLEYIAGGSLKERLHGPLPADDAVQLVEEIALGVAAIHRVGILHLDLMLGQDGLQVPVQQVVLAHRLVLASLQPLDLLNQLAVGLLPLLDLCAKQKLTTKKR